MNINTIIKLLTAGLVLLNNKSDALNIVINEIVKFGEVMAEYDEYGQAQFFKLNDCSVDVFVPYKGWEKNIIEDGSHCLSELGEPMTNHFCFGGECFDLKEKFGYNFFKR